MYPISFRVTVPWCPSFGLGHNWICTSLFSAHTFLRCSLLLGTLP